MKIRLLIDAKMLGGVETHIMNLCEELSRRQHDCRIIFIRDYPENILYTLCQQRSLVYHACKTYKELLALFIKDKPDIIHTHGYKANIIGRLFGFLSKTPIVSTFHAGEKPKGRLILYNALDRLSSFISNNICVNASIAAKLPMPSTILPNFVAIPESLNSLKTKGPYDVYFIGRVSPEKGPYRFCQLATLSSTENLRWHMVGTGPLLARCQAEYQDSVIFHGQVTNMDDLWLHVDLLCITSTEEGLPLVLLEAMSRGIPVVSFDVGSIKEVVTDATSVIDCYDLSMMKERILSHFVKTRSERSELAARARQKIISNFSRNVIVPKIEAYYDECIK